MSVSDSADDSASSLNELSGDDDNDWEEAKSFCMSACNTAML
ncbi:hypothetical protein L195_g038584 [Trifolium pratense]|uniref:Uncharacterized protein n=1 Tax=Trifolium pratense TaxID=57577 RepID=A0A2K3LVJ5_TRIPR|nr:hypothetical protein L195_g038584 [Trifolium pratense]